MPANSTLKAEAHRIVDQLSDDATWEDLLDKVDLRQAIESGLADCAEGRTVSTEEICRSFEKRYEGYGWIKVRRHQDDPSLSWEERFRLLEQHHLEETRFLIEELRRLAKECDNQNAPA